MNKNLKINIQELIECNFLGDSDLSYILKNGAINSKCFEEFKELDSIHFFFRNNEDYLIELLHEEKVIFAGVNNTIDLAFNVFAKNAAKQPQ